MGYLDIGLRRTNMTWEFIFICDCYYGIEERFAWHCEAKDENEAMEKFFKEHNEDTHEIDYIIKGRELTIKDG